MRLTHDGVSVAIPTTTQLFAQRRFLVPATSDAIQRVIPANGNTATAFFPKSRSINPGDFATHRDFKRYMDITRNWIAVGALLPIKLA